MTNRYETSIVFLDTSTLDRGDVSFEQFGGWKCEFHPRTAPPELPGRIGGFDVAVTNKVVFDSAVMDSPEAGNLKLIAIAATGTNNVDLEAARGKGIAVANVAGYSTNSVAQHTFGLLFELASRTGAYSRDVAAGAWSDSPVFTLLDRPVVEMAGKQLGIVGLGAIGSAVARAAEGFGMDVLVSARPGAEGPPPEGRVPLEKMLAEADVVSLHCPLTPATENLIGARELEMMKPTAFLINVARGGIVVEADLVAALKGGRIAGAAADVLTREPPPADNPLIAAAGELDNLVITPHTAWASREARQRLIDEIAANIRAFLEGKDRNRVA